MAKFIYHHAQLILRHHMSCSTIGRDQLIVSAPLAVLHMFIFRKTNVVPCFHMWLNVYSLDTLLTTRGGTSGTHRHARRSSLIVLFSARVFSLLGHLVSLVKIGLWTHYLSLPLQHRILHLLYPTLIYPSPMN